MTKQNKISLKITQASLNQTALDWPRNMLNIYTAIDEAVAKGSDILALEELALTGYEANDEFQRTDNNRITAALNDIALYANELDPNLIISIGHPFRLQKRDEIHVNKETSYERIKNPLYDRMNLPFVVQTLISSGKVLGMTAKSNLFNNERGYEKRYFNEWCMNAADAMGGTHGTIDISFNDQTIPFGRPITHFSDGENNLNIAHAICEEKWIANKHDIEVNDDANYETDNVIPFISKYLGSKQGLVLVIPNASPPARDKMDKHVYLSNLASKYVDIVIDTDGLGSSGSTFSQFGYQLIAQDGKNISYGKRMSFNKVATNTSTVSVGNAPSSTEDKTHASIPHEFKNIKEKPKPAIAYETDEQQAWDSPDNPNRHYEEIIRYTAFWLFDYMRKTGGKGIMEAISGGADSAFNSSIVSVMVHMGVKDLGIKNFCRELNIPQKETIKDIMKDLLTCVYMGTNNSSTETRLAAEGVANELGGKFINRNVQDLLDFYGVLYAVEDTSKMKPAEKQQMILDITTYLNTDNSETTANELKNKYPQIEDLITVKDGVAYENIQARGREVLIMLFANKENKMAIANPNLDEARNAYATYGGDLHSGTINLNAHIPKAYQLNIMKYLCKNGVQGIMPPIKSFEAILDIPPSAELLPKDAEGNVLQNDETAMQRSFEQMDAISEYMLYERKQTDNGARRLNAGEVFDECQNNLLFKNVDENNLYNMVRVSYNRWAFSQHKIHATPISPTFGRNVDHQTSQRTPNINGGSKDELTLLAIDLLFKWAEKDKLNWSLDDKKLFERRAWQDMTFIKEFDASIWDSSSEKDYNLNKLYKNLTTKGLYDTFDALDNKHPINILHKLSKKD